jgi:hypothetical protein
MTKHLLRLLALAVGIVLMAGTSPAQDQVQIIRAEFGLGNQWADVTAQVLSLVRGQGLNFRADVANLRADPVPNQRKILRLKVRNSRGQIQDLTYPEKSIVQLYVTNGPARHRMADRLRVEGMGQACRLLARNMDTVPE